MIICSPFTSWLGYAETVWDTQNGKNEIIETLIKSFYGDHFFLYQIMLKTGNRKSSKVSRFTGPAFDKYVKLVELLQYQFHGSWHYRRNSNNSVDIQYWLHILCCEQCELTRESISNMCQANILILIGCIIWNFLCFSFFSADKVSLKIPFIRWNIGQNLKDILLCFRKCLDGRSFLWRSISQVWWVRTVCQH